MKKVSFIGASRYLGVLLIAMQGILLVLLAIFQLNDAYLDCWSEYGKTAESFSIYLENISEEHGAELEQYLYTEAADNKLYIVRRDTLLANDGAFAGYIYGVYGDVENNDVEFSFGGKEVVTKEMISDLLQSQEEHATLGIDQGSEYCIHNIRTFHFGEKIVMKKLSTMILDSATVQGQYHILGADEAEQREIIEKVADICGIEKQQLLKSMHGEKLDNSLKKMILLVFLFSQTVLNFIYFLLIAIKNLDKKGKLVLMGWSGSAICYELYNCFLWYGIFMIPFIIVFGIIFSGWGFVLTAFIGQFFGYSIINMMLLVFEIGLASLVQLSVNNLDAIKRKFPKKILYLFGIAGYIGVSIAIVFCGIYIDSPVQCMNENAKISENWSQVSEYQILRNISVGNDENSFSGTSKKLDQDIYDWYSDIADNEGVYLINTTYYDNEVLNIWRDNQIYDCVPKDPFWYFTYSLSYIKELGIPLEADVEERAQNGTRVYLIPSGMEEKQKESICLWLKETSEEGIREGDIVTDFNQSRNIEFVEYDADNKFFTWSTDTNVNTCEMPVIYLCTPENMKYFETESLRAVGLEGYIKFRNKDIAQKYLNKEFLQSYQLLDNDLHFTHVKNYVDGLQKELLQTIMWFGVVFVILAVILFGIMLALATVFRIANEEILNVQKFLGYDFCNMYGKLITGLGIINVVQLLILILCKSQFGFAAVVIVVIMQWIIFGKYMAKKDMRNIIQAFREK